MGEIREEFGIKKHLKIKVVQSSVRCAEYIERMSEE